MNNEREGKHEAPPGLVHALRRLETKSVHVPESVDRAVLRAAHRRLVRPTRRGFVFWPNWIRIPALAAAAILLLVLARPFVYPGYDRKDINRDGHIDILDAFALARITHSGKTSVPTFDMNGDGVVNRRDADAIANDAVTLKKGGRS